MWGKVRNIEIKNCSMRLEGVKAKYSVMNYILSLDARGLPHVGVMLTTPPPPPPGGVGGVMGGMDVTPYGCLQRTNGGAVSG